MRFASVLGFVTLAALAAPACNIEHQEGYSDSEGSCISFCARLSACGAEQADDMDECIDACEDRFDEAEAYQRHLCACSDWSSCEDLEEGRCSSEEPEPEPGSHGGSPSAAGGSAGEGSSSNGGASTSGGSSGSGGTTADPGSCGEGGASGGGGQSGSPGSAGGGGEGGDTPPPASCVRDCDCLITEWCVDGYCSAEPG